MSSVVKDATKLSNVAAAEFRLAIAADPCFSAAFFQLGLTLFGQSTVKNGVMTAPPGTRQLFQDYLALAPNAPNAESARGLLKSISQNLYIEAEPVPEQAPQSGEQTGKTAPLAQSAEANSSGSPTEHSVQDNASSQDDKDKARRLFAVGKAAINDKDFAIAAQNFEMAVYLVPENGLMRLYLAKVQDKLDRLADAEANVARAIDSGLDESALAEARELQGELDYKRQKAQKEDEIKTIASFLEKTLNNNGKGDFHTSYSFRNSFHVSGCEVTYELRTSLQTNTAKFDMGLIDTLKLRRRLDDDIYIDITFSKAIPYTFDSAVYRSGKTTESYLETRLTDDLAKSVAVAFKRAKVLCNRKIEE